MHNFLLYGHGGSYNHGAEAIVRTTVRIIRKKYPDAHIVLSCHFPEQDKEFALPIDEIIAPDPAIWEQEKRAKNTEVKRLFTAQMYSAALNKITSDTICLAVGGDNYCYPAWHRQAIFQERAVAVGAKSILWGASVEPGAITPEMLKTFRSYTYILARENITFEALKSHGLEPVLLPDPAFALEIQSFPLPKSFLPGNTVGINLSPLVTRREPKAGIAIENINNLIAHILKTTSMNIALIPHVVMPMDDDYELLSRFNTGNHRICLLDNRRSAVEYKYVISQCAFLICARTHASIAAYSTGVPTLVVGYSNKAAGIARDLGLNDFVVDISQLCTGSVLVEGFERLRTGYPKDLNIPEYAGMVQQYARYI